MRPFAGTNRLRALKVEAREPGMPCGSASVTGGDGRGWAAIGDLLAGRRVPKPPVCCGMNALWQIRGAVQHPSAAAHSLADQHTRETATVPLPSDVSWPLCSSACGMMLAAAGIDHHAKMIDQQRLAVRTHEAP